jgi:periplasmic protein TonB
MEAVRGAQRSANGAAHARTNAAPFAVASAYDDPMSKVLGLDSKTSGLAAWLGFTSGGTLVFVALTALVLVVAWWHSLQLHIAAASKPEEIEILRDETPPPPPPEATAEKPEIAPPVAHPAAHEPPPPVAAQAAKVLTAEPKPDEPVDLTGNTIVQGNSDTYSGGFTTATGTGTAAARSAPGPAGVPGGTGPVQAAPAPPPPPPGPDLSRHASIGNREWRCPFPAEADTAQIDDAYVTLKIGVRPDGSAETVQVVADPGNGFGREARRCATSLRYQTELDHQGTPIAGTITTRVHFQR